VEAVKTIAVAEATTKADEAAAKVAPGYQICFESYGGAATVWSHCRLRK
jgi:hypothetical protein